MSAVMPMSTSPGFLFCICPDGKLLRQRVEELLADGPEKRERHLFWGDEELPDQFWELLTLQGLFSVSRALIIRNAHTIVADTWKRLSKALGRPNPRTLPLFCLEGAWERGQPKIPAHITKLPCFAFAEKKSWIWRAPGLDSRSLRRYLQLRIKALGLSCAPGALEALCEILPPDAATVENELEKLFLLSAGEPLSSEMVRTIAQGTDFNIFTFLRQLQNGQTMQVWKTLLEEQQKGEEPLFYLLVMLQREVRQLWQLLMGEQVRMPPGEVAVRQQTASRLGAAGLCRIWDALHTAELSVKSGYRSPSQALERLMEELTLLFAGAEKNCQPAFKK